MEQRQLEFFVAVAEELSFTKAAHRTHAVQSTVSASIKALERDLGTPLFDRSTAMVALTQAGAALLPEAKSAIDSLAAAREAVGSIRKGLSGSLRVGTLSGLAAVDLPGLAGDFRARHPGVHLRMTVSSGGTAGLLDKLRNRELEIAFVGVEALTVEGITLTPISTFYPRLLVPGGHPLASAEKVSCDALGGEPFIDLPLGHCNRNLTDADFRRAGIIRAVVVEVSDLATIPSFVSAGLGVAVVPPLRTDPEFDVVAVELDPPAAPWTLAVATSALAPQTKALRAFLELVPRHTSATVHY